MSHIDTEDISGIPALRGKVMIRPHQGDSVEPEGGVVVSARLKRRVGAAETSGKGVGVQS